MMAFVVSVSVLGLSHTFAAERLFPDATWEFKTPPEVGLDAARLDQLAADIGGRGCIVRNGYMVKTWGSQAQKSWWYSSSKPIFSTMLFFAIQEGKVSGVDALIKDFGWDLSAMLLFNPQFRGSRF